MLSFFTMLQTEAQMSQILPLGFFSMPGGYEWLIIGLIALLLFGKRLPGVAKSLGQAMHEFRSGLNGAVDKDDAASAPPKKAETKEDEKTETPS